MDVVPVYADQWTHPPFAAEIDSEGKIFGRGSQDTKQLGIQFLAAIRALKLAGIKQLKRTVHVTFAPNEEVGGVYGWQDFVHTDDFRQMNIGFFLDEGLSSEKDGFIALYAERTTFATIFEISGESGHGALPLENTVGEKARYILDRMMNMRDVENNRLKANESLPVGNTTTINLTMMKGGIQINVVPQNVTLAFDVRVAIDVDLIELKKKVSPALYYLREKKGIVGPQIYHCVLSSKFSSSFLVRTMGPRCWWWCNSHSKIVVFETIDNENR